jgi:S-layer protein (TIGR01567 family)
MKMRHPKVQSHISYQYQTPNETRNNHEMLNMNKINLITIIALLAAAMAAGAADTVDVRGQVATGNFTWTSQNFAGFYYDLESGQGAETLTTSLSDGNLLRGDEPYGVEYQASAQAEDFKFKGWGAYGVMGFLSKKYFASYIESNIRSPMVNETSDENQLACSQLLEVLRDDDAEETITFSSPLKLEDGYVLAIRSVDSDGKKVFLELAKEGVTVDYDVISPSREGATLSDKTYCYKQDVGEAKDVVIIAVHFKDAFHGSDEDIATIDGQWQLSDTPLSVRTDTSFGRMVVTSVDANNLTMTLNNKDNSIALSRNKDIALMPGIGIRTGDSDELRYYIYEPIKVWVISLPTAPYGGYSGTLEG